jgi:surface antigen
MEFVMRTTKPCAGNKYYIRKASGGYSNAIQGKPKDSECDVLSNCVGYAYGRFNEIGGYGYCRYLAPVNAENFMQYKGSCKVGQVPKLGACMVWQKGATLSGSDGAGHVAIVEKVISDTEVYTSESGYNSRPFWNQTRKKGANGRWGSSEAYTFLGFIYNPAVADDDTCEEAPLDAERERTDPCEIVVGDVVKIVVNAKYATGQKVPAWVRKKKWIVENAAADYVIINRSTDGKNAIKSPISREFLTVVAKAVSQMYRVKVTASVLNIRKGPETNYKRTGCITDKGEYTIVEESSGAGATVWGRLDKGGWISLDYTQKA